MNTLRKEKFSSPATLVKPARDKENDFVKRNLQLMRNREIDALVEMSRQVMMDKYMDLEN